MKKLFVALLSIACLASCSDKNTFKMNVNLENSNGKTVYLKQYVYEDLVTIDSAVVKNNSSTFKIAKGEDLDAFIVDINGLKRPLVVFTDNVDVTITGDCQNYNGITIKAGSKQDALNALADEMNSIEDETTAMYTAMRYIKENRGNVTGPYALYRYKWAFQYDDIIRLLNVFENVNSGYIKLMKHYAEGLERVSVGHLCIDFEIEDINGNLFSLKKTVMKNRLVMIDFWASWCPDCRKENPNVVAVYNAFKNKGFNIVSVSLDNDKESLIKAINDDNLSWENHVSDYKGWNNKIAGEYCISFIPQNVLIDNNGMIIAKNLAGDELMNFVSNYLK